MYILDYVIIFGAIWGAVYAYREYKRRENFQNFYSKAFGLLATDTDIKKFLLAGMYQRFKHEEGKTEDTPWDFEAFVGKVIEEYYQGEVEVTPRTNDGGIDFKLYKGNSLYLGQVKCYDPNNLIDYKPIAILHSQMVKQGAIGGIFVTTSSYNDGAVAYCDGINMNLIDGEQFLNMWLRTVEKANLYPSIETISEGV